MINERLKKAKDRLDLYYEAEVSILSGQAYTIGTRSLTRADLKEVRKAIVELERQIALLTVGGKRTVKRVVPLDV